MIRPDVPKEPEPPAALPEAEPTPAPSPVRRRPPGRVLPLGELARFPATSGVCLLAIAATLVSWTHPLVAQLAMHGDVLSDHPWTPFTSALLHVNVLHLVFNVYWTLAIGVHVERENGSLRTFVGYALAAAGSGMAEQALLHGGVGLSGVGYAIFAYGWARGRSDASWARIVDSATTQSFVYWFFFCIVTTITGYLPVANVAHGVGAILGGLAGLAHRDRRLLAPLALVLALAFVLDLEPVRDRVNLAGEPAIEAEARALDLLNAGQSAAALPELRRAAALAPREPRVLYNLGVALFRTGDEGGACDAFRAALDLDPGADYAREAVASCPP